MSADFLNDLGLKGKMEARLGVLKDLDALHAARDATAAKIDEHRRSVERLEGEILQAMLVRNLKAIALGPMLARVKPVGLDGKQIQFELIHVLDPERKS